MRNMPLMQIHLEAMMSINNSEFSRVFSLKRLLLEIGDSSDLFFNPQKSDKGEWEKRNLYSYDIVVAEGERDSLYNYILRDLNKYSPYIGKIEKRKVKCLALVRTGSDDKIKTKGGLEKYNLYNDEGKKYLNNLSVALFVWRLDRMQSITLPVIDETNYKDHIDLVLNINLDDIGDIKRGLQLYDLDLVEVEREIEMFVIMRKGSDPKLKN